MNFNRDYGYITSNIAGVIEIIANSILLLALTPIPSTAQCCKKIKFLSLDENFYSKPPSEWKDSFTTPKNYYFE